MSTRPGWIVESTTNTVSGDTVKPAPVSVLVASSTVLPFTSGIGTGALIGVYLTSRAWPVVTISPAGGLVATTTPSAAPGVTTSILLNASPASSHVLVASSSGIPTTLGSSNDVGFSSFFNTLNSTMPPATNARRAMNAAMPYQLLRRCGGGCFGGRDMGRAL